MPLTSTPYLYTHVAVGQGSLCSSGAMRGIAWVLSLETGYSCCRVRALLGPHICASVWCAPVYTLVTGHGRGRERGKSASFGAVLNTAFRDQR